MKAESIRCRSDIDLFDALLKNPDVQRVNEQADGTRFNFTPFQTSISADGRLVAFETLESLAANDSRNFDIYLRDMETGAFTRVSQTAAGDAASSSSGRPSRSVPSAR